MHNVMATNNLPETMIVSWYKVNFRLQKETYWVLTKFWHWILIIGMYWWEFSAKVRLVGSWKTQVVVAEDISWRLIFQSIRLKLLKNFNRFIPTSQGQSLLSWSKTKRLPYLEGVYFSGTLYKFYYLLFFRVMSSESALKNCTVDVMLQGLPFVTRKSKKVSL